MSMPEITRRRKTTNLPYRIIAGNDEFNVGDVVIQGKLKDFAKNRGYILERFKERNEITVRILDGQLRVIIEAKAK